MDDAIRNTKKFVKLWLSGTTLSLIPAKVYTDFKGLAPDKEGAM
jgi:hypothetical protein